jgi:hypothetical protein
VTLADIELQANRGPQNDAPISEMPKFSNSSIDSSRVDEDNDSYFEPELRSDASNFSDDMIPITDIELAPPDRVQSEDEVMSSPPPIPLVTGPPSPSTLVPLVPHALLVPVPDTSSDPPDHPNPPLINLPPSEATTVYEQHLQDIEWESENHRILSYMSNILSLSDADTSILITQCSMLKLDNLTSYPANIRELRNAENVACDGDGAQSVECPLEIPVSESGDVITSLKSYSVVFYNIFDKLQELMDEPAHCKHWQWRPRKQYTEQKDGRGTILDEDLHKYDPEDLYEVLDEVFTAAWFLEQQNLIGWGNLLLSIILAMDETTMTHAGRKVCVCFVCLFDFQKWFHVK